MKRIVVGMMAVVIAVVLPRVSVAGHGGVQHVTRDAIITLYQTPLSPLLGENVTTEFVVANKNGERLKNLPVTLTLIDTHFGDATKDRTVVTTQFTTNANGMFTFTHTYDQPDYYDIELKFAVADVPQDAGFLLQVRSPDKSWGVATYALAAVVAGGVGWFVIRQKLKSSAKSPLRSQPQSPNITSK